jgi:hypothetical protein
VAKRDPGRSAQADRDRRLTKAERKEQARVEREAIQRRMAARRRNRLAGLGVLLVAGAVAITLLVVLGGDGSTGPNGSNDGSQSSLPGTLTTNAPWPANTDQLAARLQELGLPAGGIAEHVHSALSIYIHGQQEVVPADIGRLSNAFAALHTHDATGTIHVEAASPYQFTLGQFFDVWGVRFTSTCIGGYCASGDDQLRVYENGQPVAGDPRNTPLSDQAVIVVAFGTEQEVPNPVPTAVPSGFPQPAA